jgi:hypothetical protein
MRKDHGMTNRVDTVPNTLARFTHASIALHLERTTAPPQVSEAIHWTPSDRHGRIPTIGLDTGHIPGTRPDTIRWGAA